LKLGVAGAGAMGSGIALVALLAGYKVSLYDINPDVQQKALDYIRTQLEKRKRLLDLEHLSQTTRLEDLRGASAVIEAAPEDLSVKQDLFARLSEICPPPAVLATNTSTLSVTEIASAAIDPSRVAGMHFFNPAPVMPLVEVVSGAQTSPEVVRLLINLATKMGKQPVEAKDTPGFIVNRVARPFYGEALRILAEGTAPHDVIDRILRLGGGFKMGPFQLLDLIGIDVNFAATRSVFEQTFYEPRYRPSIIQAQMVAQKALGRKTGGGFYEYDSRGNAVIPQTDTVAEIPCQGSGNQVTVSAGSFAPGLADLFRGCDWNVAEISAGLRDSKAVIITAGRTEGAVDLVRKVDFILPPSIPLIIQCADLALSEAAHVTAHPERCVGFDGLFFTGGEIVTLSHASFTSLEAIATAAGIFHSIGKVPIQIQESPALVLPRIVCALVNEAAFALGEGVANASTIDLAMQLGTNYPQGPLAWGKAIGHPQVAAVMDHLHKEYGEDRYRLAPILRRWSRLP
jgi:3-hydroxybutyryl-CoA dehydrogenase